MMQAFIFWVVFWVVGAVAGFTAAGVYFRRTRNTNRDEVVTVKRIVEELRKKGGLKL